MLRRSSPPLLLSCLIACTGCSPLTLPADPAIGTPKLAAGLDKEHPHLEANWKVAEAACLNQDRALRQQIAASATNRRAVEAVLAATAGALALTTALYAGRADVPNANIVVPLTGGAAAAATPLFVLLLQGNDGPGLLAERQARVQDRRQAVLDAYNHLLAVRKERERAGSDLASLERAVPKARLDELRQKLGAVKQGIDRVEKDVAEPWDKAPAPSPQGKPRKESASPKDSASPKESVTSRESDEMRKDLAETREAEERAAADLEAARAALLSRAEADFAAARQNEQGASDALDGALQHLWQVCGQDAR